MRIFNCSDFGALFVDTKIILIFEFVTNFEIMKFTDKRYQLSNFVILILKTKVIYLFIDLPIYLFKKKIF